MAFRPAFTPLGRVVRVSDQEIEFEYTPFEGPYKAFDPGVDVAIDIFDMEHIGYVSKVPCRVKSDASCGDDGDRENSLFRRRCGLRFVDLSETQKRQIGYFKDIIK